MRVREMHPLCCISLECPGIGRHGPGAARDSCSELAAAGGGEGEPPADASAAGAVAGVLCKWTNYGKGWRSRWFLLRNGVLSYSKVGRSDALLPAGEVRVIGKSCRRPDAAPAARKQRIHNTVGVVHLKISSFRESRSDDRRFYIFTGTKTLHLRAKSQEDRATWIEALIAARSLSSWRPLGDSVSLIRNGVSISTRKLRDRLFEEGLGEDIIKDCEKIMLSEFSELKGQLKLLYEERLNLVDTLRQLEDTSVVEASDIQDGSFRLTNNENSSPANEKYSACSGTESSDENEKQDFEDLSDEEGCSFFDTVEYFGDYNLGSGLFISCFSKDFESQNLRNNDENMIVGIEENNSRYPVIERRKRLPDPVQKEKGVSLWSMIKDNVGKDLTRICLPVYFNEPISSLQKCFEDMEYSHLLDQAYEYGKMGNSLMRMLNVAAFAVSGYASSEGRHCKPFNPLLGETYEADYPDRGIRFFSEKVSHHPMLIACHCEGRGWKFWGESNIRSKFWGRSIQLDPVGVLTLEFDDGEVFQWSKVTTTIYNLILGKIYCDHHGTMQIQGNRQYSCKLKFKEQSFLDRNPRQVQGFVEDVSGAKVASLFGKWDDSMYFILDKGPSKAQGSTPLLDASMLWKRNKPPENLTRYNLTSFAITLNEMTPGLKGKLPPTDSRLRPDQRHLENGEYDKADSEKLRLERRQRMSRKLQESGWTPRWFQLDSVNGQYRYIGGYWEARGQKKWDGCPNIFEDISVYSEPA